MINEIENDLILLVNETMPGKLKKVAALPGPLNEDLLKIIIAASPAVYFSYLGGNGSPGDTQMGIWVMYMVTSDGGSDKRRVGDTRVLGAYNLIDILLPTVNNHSIRSTDDAGTMEFKRIQNLFTIPLNKKGVTVYAATFSLKMSIEWQADLTKLDDFVTYSADHSIIPGTDEPLAQDNVTLDQ